MTSSIQEKWFFRAATGAIRGPHSEDAVRGLISDKVILRETEIWTSLDKAKVSAGTSARFAGCFPQQIDLDPSDSPPDSPPGNAGSFGKAAQQKAPAQEATSTGSNFQRGKGKILQSGSLKTGLRTYTNSIGMEFVLIPVGSFMWEEVVEEKGKNVFGETERTIIPAREVTISKPFYLGKYAVTQEQWYAVMGKNPAHFPGRKNPVEKVSWKDVQKFIKRLNAKEGHTRYRLPTEAKWEYAARAGSNSTYFFGNSEKSLGRYAWYSENSGGTTHPVGQKKPNAWGLYDIYGNVCEWVQDRYGEYPKSSVTDPRGPSWWRSSLFRVLRGGSLFRVDRGGSWGNSAEHCRSADRSNHAPDLRSRHIGFRLALSPE
jgi:formylglycine-generating enzyme required for sulfatase activity